MHHAYLLHQESAIKMGLSEIFFTWCIWLKMKLSTYTRTRRWRREKERSRSTLYHQPSM